MSRTGTICISEILGPTIQGEGALIGRPTVFVRTGGCDFRCTWCDTLHAVESRFQSEWTAMTAQEILAEVKSLAGPKPLTISLSGGNPALQPLGQLIALGKSSGYTFALETQGSIAKEWFAGLDFLIISPKPPSSGMKADKQKLQECLAAAGKASSFLKFVVEDETDYLFARQAAAWFPRLPVSLQPCNPPPAEGTERDPADIEKNCDRLRWLVGRVIADAWYEVRVLPQLHVLLWGSKRGV
ncbi:MAG: 7-carboxy-7-deazaguanine synthase [Desulfobulbaceae bacterium BRH_c16a]|nr:MAG: 7-carboxy-7-deazaguanine synthase [Desulfobulbaceae bacterium BRH_c16a]